jgi:hypothetical protein
VITARAPPLSIRTEEWPGVCPGVGEQCDARRDLVGTADQFGLSGGDHGKDAFGIGLTRVLP